MSTVSALDRANAEDALLPMPKFFDLHHQKKGHQNSSIVPDEVMSDDLFDSKQRAPVEAMKGVPKLCQKVPILDTGA